MVRNAIAYCVPNSLRREDDELVMTQSSVRGSEVVSNDATQSRARVVVFVWRLVMVLGSCGLLVWFLELESEGKQVAFMERTRCFKFRRELSI